MRKSEAGRGCGEKVIHALRARWADSFVRAIEEAAQADPEIKFSDMVAAVYAAARGHGERGKAR